jgi:catechol 2,3-dioxygenase-like lactoylglutathione lyase family enzyme
MRGLFLFLAGFLVALALQSAIAQNQNRGIVGLHHVGISVPNLDQAVAYYTKTLGFPEAFRTFDDKGQPILVYLQMSRDTFLELQAANAERPPGISHFGVVVQNMQAATALFQQRGANVSKSLVGSTKAIVSNVTDPNGVRMELLEITPESLQRQASERWK